MNAVCYITLKWPGGEKKFFCCCFFCFCFLRLWLTCFLESTYNVWHFWCGENVRKKELHYLEYAFIVLLTNKCLRYPPAIPPTYCPTRMFLNVSVVFLLSSLFCCFARACVSLTHGSLKCLLSLLDLSGHSEKSYWLYPESSLHGILW